VKNITASLLAEVKLTYILYATVDKAESCVVTHDEFGKVEKRS